MAKRSYGTGSLMVRRDGRGRETRYGSWRVWGWRVKRVLGPKRSPGSRDGLTRTQAEGELCRQTTIVKARRSDKLNFVTPESLLEVPDSHPTTEEHVLRFVDDANAFEDASAHVSEKEFVAIRLGASGPERDRAQGCSGV